MDRQTLEKLLAAVRRGTVPLADAIERLQSLGTTDLGFARIDHHRTLRRGMPEVVFAPGKTDEQVVQIVGDFARRKKTVLVSRLAPRLAKRLSGDFKDGAHDAVARTFWLPGAGPSRERVEGLLIVSAGTADLPVAEEAAVTAQVFGLKVDRLYDVGVAGLHRLLAETRRLRRAKTIIVVAGMEGALASVVVGLVECPVIGVPTSVGYGAAHGGLTALFAMLTSCSGGLTVVNIDNGFGAACAARAILTRQAGPIPRHRVRK